MMHERIDLVMTAIKRLQRQCNAMSGVFIKNVTRKEGYALTAVKNTH